MINGNFVNQNQWLQNNNSFSSFTDASSFASLGNGTFTNSPTVQTFGNIAPGSSYGVTQNINYSQPGASFANTGFGGTGFAPAPIIQQPQIIPQAYSMPIYQPPQQQFYPQPQPYYPQPQPYYPAPAGGDGSLAILQAVLVPLMQMMQSMMMMFMQNGAFVGPGFQPSLQYPGQGNQGYGQGYDQPQYEEEIIDETIVVEHGRVWGDPHFVGAEGGKYDVMGEPGKVYNILSDRGIQMNARFDSWKGQADATIMSDVGITLGRDQVQFGVDGKLFINGEEVEDGQHLGGKVVKNGDTVTINSGEYEITLKDNGDHLNYDFKSSNVVSDGVKPHGLWGQSADGDGNPRNGDEGKGAQGGGAIEKLDGTISERGDKETYKLYEVGGLFDTNFQNFNKFRTQARPGNRNAFIAANGAANADFNF